MLVLLLLLPVLLLLLPGPALLVAWRLAAAPGGSGCRHWWHVDWSAWGEGAASIGASASTTSPCSMSLVANRPRPCPGTCGQEGGGWAWTAGLV